jgi:hypothetical protein
MSAPINSVFFYTANIFGVMDTNILNYNTTYIDYVSEGKLHTLK